MVSVMPPSGVGGFPGTAAGFEAALASRYNHFAVMDYYQAAKTRKSRKPVSAATTLEAKPKPKLILPSCGIAGCRGCQQPPAPQAPRQQQPAPVKFDPSMGDGGPPRVRNPNPPHPSSAGVNPAKALFVDCSVEYELPMVPKIPSDSQPLLVIHPGWQQKRRITRSSSQQRMALQQQHHQYLQYMEYSMAVCSQCPPLNSTTTVTTTSSTAAAAAAASRKRSYQQSNPQQLMQQQQPQQQPRPPQPAPPPPPPCCYSDRTLGFDGSTRSKRARLSSSDHAATATWWPCQERSCIEQQQRQQQMALMHQQQQQQQHQYMLRNQWPPLPLPAPPPPVSHPRTLVPTATGFFQVPPGGVHAANQYWHPAYFCPPSAVQQPVQPMIQQPWYNQAPRVGNNNHPCVKCAEGKCNMMYPPLPNPVHLDQSQPPSRRNTTAAAVTNVRYRSV